jgi:YesN/AraC family two-component response regulator
MGKAHRRGKVRRLLLVDDEVSILHALRRAISLSSIGRDVEFELFSKPKDAVLRCAEAPFDLIFSDYRMPDLNGVDFLHIAKEIQPHAARILLTGFADFNVIQEAINDAQIFRYLLKPWEQSSLEECISLAWEHSDHLRENERLASVLRNSAVSAEQRELIRLENEEPGITQVVWDAQGSLKLFVDK